MKRQSQIAISLLICILPSIQVASQSLSSYIQIAAENNPGLKSRYAEFEASLERVAQANSLPDPAITFGYFIMPVETRVGPQQARIGLSQMFPWFGTLEARGEIASLTAQAKYQEFLDARNELSYKVKSAWYPLYALNRTIKLQEAELHILRTYKELATISFKHGKSTMVDVLRTDIMLNNLQTEIRLLRDKAIPLITRFNSLLNRTETTEVVIPDSISIREFDVINTKDSLLELNPMLEAYDLKLRSAELNEELAHKNGMPQFGFGIDYVIVGSGTSSTERAGSDALMPKVSVSLPIFRTKYRAAEKEARLTQSAVQWAKTEHQNTLESIYDETSYQMESARQLIELYRIQVNTTKQSRDLLLKAYSNSGEEFEEILRMQQEILKYQISEARAVADFYIAKAKRDYITAKTQ